MNEKDQFGAIDQPGSGKAEKDERPAKDRWDKSKILGEFILTLAALVWAVLSWWMLQYHERATTERQAQSAVESLHMQQKLSAAQLAGALISKLISEKEAERDSALLILTAVDPDLASRISDVLKKYPTTADHKRIVSEINELSVRSKANRDFSQHLESARVLQGYGLDAQAAREYLIASQSVPVQFTVDQQKVRKAILAYDADRFYESARLFDEAFRGIASK
ncbi:MAG: hypothetical protein ABSH28_01460 [Acidobacteriota bacterium]|jgi:hypothetical protein